LLLLDDTEASSSQLRNAERLMRARTEAEQASLMALYLLHFDKSLGTVGRSAANHYLGYASDEGDALINRVNQHLTGRSDVKIVQAFDRIGAVGRLVSVFWHATHDDERRMKKQRRLRPLVPDLPRGPGRCRRLLHTPPKETLMVVDERTLEAAGARALARADAHGARRYQAHWVPDEHGWKSAFQPAGTRRRIWSHASTRPPSPRDEDGTPTLRRSKGCWWFILDL
jgi:hypothetical protein